MEGVAHFAAQLVVVLRGGVLRAFVFFAHGVELFGGIEGVVGVAFFDELFCVFVVDAEGFAFALAVGAVGAALVGAFVGFEAGPLEGVEDVLFGSGDVAALVGVFDAEDEGAAVAAGIEIVIEDGADAAEVKAAGGAGGEA